jgi:predicted lipid-binding transport protein (Tim44 family)
MKSYKTFILPFLSGLMIAALFHLSYRCQKDDENPMDTGPEADLEQLADDAVLAEEAFMSGDTAQIRLVMTPEAYSFYSEALANQTAARFTEFANAFKERKLGQYSAIYAEYEYTDDGKAYTVAFAVTGDNSWKIIRF